MTQPTAESLLMGGGKTRSASFKGAFPITWSGVIVEPPATVQERNFYDKDELLFWDAAKTQPKWQIVVKIQTDVRVPEDEEYGVDDGVRSIFLKFKSQAAVKEALMAAGETSLKPGGVLSLTYYADQPLPAGKKGEPIKLYRAAYLPPDPGAAANAVLMSDPPISPAAPPAPPAGHSEASVLDRLRAQQQAAIGRINAIQTAHHSSGDAPF